MAAKKKHAPSVLITDEENSLVREILGQQRYVSIIVKSKNVNLVLGARFHEKTSATCGQNCSSKYSCTVSKFALSSVCLATKTTVTQMKVSFPRSYRSAYNVAYSVKHLSLISSR